MKLVFSTSNGSVNGKTDEGIYYNHRVNTEYEVFCLQSLKDSKSLESYLCW